MITDQTQSSSYTHEPAYPILPQRVSPIHKHLETLLTPIDHGKLKHAEADHHNNWMVGLDEPHSSHIGNKVKRMVKPNSDLQAVAHHLEINQDRIHDRTHLQS